MKKVQKSVQGTRRLVSPREADISIVSLEVLLSGNTLNFKQYLKRSFDFWHDLKGPAVAYTTIAYYWLSIVSLLWYFSWINSSKWEDLTWWLLFNCLTRKNRAETYFNRKFLLSSYYFSGNNFLKQDLTWYLFDCLIKQPQMTNN